VQQESDERQRGDNQLEEIERLKVCVMCVCVLCVFVFVVCYVLFVGCCECVCVCACVCGVRGVCVCVHGYVYMCTTMSLRYPVKQTPKYIFIYYKIYTPNIYMHIERERERETGRGKMAERKENKSLPSEIMSVQVFLVFAVALLFMQDELSRQVNSDVDRPPVRVCVCVRACVRACVRVYVFRTGGFRYSFRNFICVLGYACDLHTHQLWGVGFHGLAQTVVVPAKAW